jgi:predicted RNA-binding Zn-ribbon protein involved in translation (DUF1610 family)
MPERDRWTEVLRCSNCGASARAVLSQENPTSPAYHDGTDQNVRVELAPSGFSAVITEHGPKFYCVNCGVLAHHD